MIYLHNIAHKHINSSRSTGLNLELTFVTTGEVGLYLGLKVLLKAMVDAQVRPKKLDLEVQKCKAHSFLISATPQELTGIFQVLGHLTLRGEFRYLTDLESRFKLSPVTITKSTFPMLQSLHVDSSYQWGESSGLNSSAPRSSELPGLIDLTIEGQNNRIRTSYSR